MLMPVMQDRQNRWNLLHPTRSMANSEDYKTFLNYISVEQNYMFWMKRDMHIMYKYRHKLSYLHFNYTKLAQNLGKIWQPNCILQKDQN